jgi:hypothetical protein
MKLIEATMPDGQTVQIEAHTVADTHAEFIIAHSLPFESIEKDDEIYAKVYPPLMQDDYRLVTLASEMSWLQLKRLSPMWALRRSPSNYEEDWPNAPKRIVETEEPE